MKNNDLPPELKALCEEAAALPEPDLEGIAKANRALANNPEFAAKIRRVSKLRTHFLETT